MKNFKVTSKEDGKTYKTTAFSWKSMQTMIMIPPITEVTGSREYSPELLTPTEFETPEEFIEFVDNLLAEV